MTNVLHLDALVDVAPAPDHEAVERAQTRKHEPEVSGVDLNQKLILMTKFLFSISSAGIIYLLL